MPKAAPTEAETLEFLQTAKSPKDDGDFFEAIQKAIQERRVDLLTAAAKNPDKNLKFHPVAIASRLPKSDRCQLWSSMLAEQDWTQTTAGLKPESAGIIQRIAQAEAEALIGDSNAGLPAKMETRQRLRTQLQHARLLEIGKEQAAGTTGPEVDWIGELEQRNDLGPADVKLLTTAITDWAKAVSPEGGSGKQAAQSNVVSRLSAVLVRAIGPSAGASIQIKGNAGDPKAWVQSTLKRSLQNKNLTPQARSEIEKGLSDGE